MSMLLPKFNQKQSLLDITHDNSQNVSVLQNSIIQNSNQNTKRLVKLKQSQVMFMVKNSTNSNNNTNNNSSNNKINNNKINKHNDDTNNNSLGQQQYLLTSSLLKPHIHNKTNKNSSTKHIRQHPHHVKNSNSFNNEQIIILKQNTIQNIHLQRNLHKNIQFKRILQQQLSKNNLKLYKQKQFYQNKIDKIDKINKKKRDFIIYEEQEIAIVIDISTYQQIRKIAKVKVICIQMVSRSQKQTVYYQKRRKISITQNIIIKISIEQIAVNIHILEYGQQQKQQKQQDQQFKKRESEILNKRESDKLINITNKAITNKDIIVNNRLKSNSHIPQQSHYINKTSCHNNNIPKLQLFLLNFNTKTNLMSLQQQQQQITLQQFKQKCKYKIKQINFNLLQANQHIINKNKKNKKNSKNRFFDIQQEQLDKIKKQAIDQVQQKVQSISTHDDNNTHLNNNNTTNKFKQLMQQTQYKQQQEQQSNIPQFLLDLIMPKSPLQQVKQGDQHQHKSLNHHKISFKIQQKEQHNLTNTNNITYNNNNNMNNSSAKNVKQSYKTLRYLR